MSFPADTPLPLAVFAAETQGRLRYRLPLVTYTNSFEPQAHTLWMSPQVEAVTGYRADEWVGNRGFFEQILHPDDRRSVLEDVQRSRQRLRPFSRDYRLSARDGRTVWIHDESVPVLDAEGRPEFIQGYFVDITERKQLENALLHAQRVEAAGRLAAGVAHDFNNLLTAISGYATMAELELEDEHPAGSHVRAIRKAVDRAVKLTRKLLAFSRRQELSMQVVDLAELVRESESMLLHVAGAGIEVEFLLDSTASVYADLGQLEQVLLNLVANARDAMPAGGRITVGTALATLEAGPEARRLGAAPGDYAVLTVADTGVGMDPETQQRIFEPFFTTKDRDSGTGLGLSMVHGIITQSGGAIDVTSALGAGTTFRILLPVAAVG